MESMTSCITYQPWDVQSGNLIDEFDEEAEALDTARAYLAPDDAGVTVEVGLVVFGDDDQPLRSIHGDELRALVFGASVNEARRSAQDLPPPVGGIVFTQRR